MSRRLSIAMMAALLVASCAAPPSKEMNQAQGAIDAARAAGAEQYATEEFGAAVASLKQSQDAVEQRDYRSALNFAVDSLERAQNAAKQASEQRAAVQSEAARALADTRALLDRADQRLAAADSARVPRRTLAQARATLAHGRTAMQKAGAAAERGEFAMSQRELAAVQQQATAAIEEIDGAITPRPNRPARGRR